MEMFHGTIFEDADEKDDYFNDPKDMWHDRFLDHIIDNDYPNTKDVEAKIDELYENIEKRTATMKKIKHLYFKAIEMSAELKTDLIHKLIKSSVNKILDDEDNDIEEK